MNATVVGGGLAGSEAAWALAERGVRVTLYEMRPAVQTPAHQTDRLAELVCSNSFKSVELTNAHGLLKAELRALGSLLLAVRRPGAGARRHGARGGSRGLLPGGARAGHGAPEHHRGRARRRPSCRRPASSPPARSPPPASPRPSSRGSGSAALAFYDAIAPIVSSDSLDHERLYALSRYGKGDGDDYLNAPMDAAGLRARSSTR